jgi:hypothetical protein
LEVAQVTKTNENAPAASNVDEGIAERRAWILKAVAFIRDNPTSDKAGKGAHVVYSGFNAAYSAKFGGEQSREVVDAMVAEGAIYSVPRRGGPMLFLPEDYTPSAREKVAIGLASL